MADQPGSTSVHDGRPMTPDEMLPPATQRLPHGRTSPATPLIEFHGVSKSHLTKKRVIPVFKDLDLTVYKSEFLCVVGPSGCGKSTLLNLIAGLDFPEAGTLTFGGEPVTGVNTGLGYITQKDTLLPWRNARANVAIGLELQKRDRRSRSAAVDSALAAVGLDGYETLHPSQLSGGMRKRVQLARTLVCEPDTLLCDEPFAALDAQTRIVMQQDLLRLREDRLGELTTIFITHDIVEAVALGDRVLVLSARPARPIAIEVIDDIDDRSDLMALQDTPAFRKHLDRVWSVLSSQFDTAADGRRRLPG
jgi:NitT/TauT family transport system ATP-binding protein